MERSQQPRTPLEPIGGQTGIHVLVAYATRSGSTRGIAHGLARRLAGRGMTVDLRCVEEIDGLGSYDAVVFGSPVYDRRWPAEAEAWLRRHRGALSGYPTWLFSVATFGDDRRALGRLISREPRGIRALREVIDPRGYRAFAGVVDRRRWPMPSRLLLRALGGRLGDNRDWPEIEAWGDSIARTLPASAPL